MRVLLCSNTFSSVGNGPTKFARLLYSSKCDGFDLHILTEDVHRESDRLHKCEVNLPRLFFWAGPFWRMVAYGVRAVSLNSVYQFDYYLYNNSIFGAAHALLSSKTIGMINDDYLLGEVSVGLRLSWYDRLRRLVFRQLEAFSIRNHKLILTNSRYLNDLYRRKYPKYEHKFRVLYKGIQLNSSKINEIHHELSLDTSPIRILFVKNNFRLGGLENLMRALSSIEASFLLTVIGPDQVMEGAIRKLATPNVELRFLGRQSQEVVYKEMLNHHVFCVPSFLEALGVANLEALSVGIPVVATRTGGIPEVVSDGRAAFLTEPGNIVSLREGLMKCFTDRALRTEMVRVGLRDAQAFHFDNTIATLSMILRKS